MGTGNKSKGPFLWSSEEFIRGLFFPQSFPNFEASLYPTLKVSGILWPRTILLQRPWFSFLWYSSSSLTVESEEAVNQTHKEKEGVNVEDTHANFYVICTYYQCFPGVSILLFTGTLRWAHWGSGIKDGGPCGPAMGAGNSTTDLCWIFTQELTWSGHIWQLCKPPRIY